jgi:hypothetical protein
MCFILSAEWLGDDDADAVERAADPRCTVPGSTPNRLAMTRTPGLPGVARAAMEKAVAEHIAAHPEDAGRTVKDFRWVVWEIVRKPQELFEGELTAKDTDEDAAVSETDLNVLTPPDPDYLARSKPWRPVHQRPARDMRRPTWKKWER